MDTRRAKKKSCVAALLRVWIIFLSDDPRDNSYISQKEIEFIETNRQKFKLQSGFPPYLEILKCPAVWTVMICDFANGWGLYTLLNDGPTFMNKILHQDITKV